MTEDQLNAIEARADAATLGPWWIPTEEQDGLSMCDGVSIVCGYENSEYGFRKRVLCSMNHWFEAEYNYNSPDKHFIAEARQDIPALVAEVRRLQREIDRMNGESEDANGN